MLKLSSSQALSSALISLIKLSSLSYHRASLSLSHSLSSSSLNSGLKLIVNVAFAGLNVTDLSPNPRLCWSDPRRHRPPQAASHHRRPSLYSLCCDWFFFFLMYFHMSLVAMVVVFDFGFGEFSGFLFCSSSLVWLCWFFWVFVLFCFTGFDGHGGVVVVQWFLWVWWWLWWCVDGWMKYYFIVVFILFYCVKR